jgi:TonB-dependent receptor
LRLGAVAAAVAVSSSGAMAQQAAATEPGPEQVVVTGLRNSLVKAQDIKRNAEQVVDSIVADDIGKLPDANVAEALQRVSGVQISRNRGEGDRVQVRGLSQTQTLLNGRVIFTAGKERGLSFQDVPAELLAGADVYKTPTADQIDGGIGGLIDLRTRRPFDFAGAKVAGTLKATHADLAEKTNGEGSLLLSNRWKLGDGEFGALLSVSTQRRDYRADTQEIDAPALLADGSGTFAPTGEWLAYEFGQRERTAASAALQYRPGDGSQYTLDLNHSQLKTRTNVWGFYGSPFWANWSATNNQGALWPNGSITVDDQGRFQKGTFWGASMNTSSYIADEDTTIDQVALAGKWSFGAWRVGSEVSHTDSEFERFYQEVRLGTWGDSPSFSYDMTTEVPSGMPVGAALDDPAHYWADKTLYFRIHNKGEETAWRLDGDRSFDDGLVSRVRAGVRLSDRRASSAEINTIDNIWTQSSTPISGAVQALYDQVGLIPKNDLLQRAGTGSYPTQWLGVTDFDWLRDASTVRSAFGLAVPDFDPAQTFRYSERSAAVYGTADFETSLGGLPLTGNVGLRVVSTEDKRRYNALVDGVATPTSVSNNDLDVLPALNLRLELSKNLLARLALSKVVTRPNFDQLTPSLSLNVNDHTGYQGNPALGAMSARQLDTTLEYYISKSDSLYGAAFYKQVDGFIQSSVSQATIGGTTYTLSTPVNGKDGSITGLEVGYQGFFSNLPGWLSGLGVQTNYTYVDSSAPGPIDGRQAPLQGLSRNSFNIVGLYDMDAFSFRLAYNWRDKYTVGTARYFPANDGSTALTPVMMKGYGMLDAYISYAITPQVKLAIEANNLTGTVRHTYYGVDNLARGTYVDDRRYALSLHVDL